MFIVLIVESGEVVRLDDGFVWIKTIRKSTCGACQARHGCGQKLLNQLSSESADIKAKLNTNFPKNTLAAGDTVEIGIAESAVVLSSLLTYGLPLFCLIVAVVLVAPIGSDLITALSGASALALGVLIVRWGSPKYCPPHLFEPIVLRKI